MHNIALELKRTDEIVYYPVIKMALDVRLECLMKAINEDWGELGAREEDRALVVWVKESEKPRQTVRMPPAGRIMKQVRPMASGKIERNEAESLICL